MSIGMATTTLDGVEIPAAGAWSIDPSHSTVGFAVRHLMVTKVRGRFGTFAGSIEIGDEPEASGVEVTIDASSIDTRDEGRDAHLRSPDFLDVEAYPTLSFRSTGFVRTGKGTFSLPGDLTVRGVTRPVTLDVAYEGVALDPWGNTRAAFTARTEIDRESFGLTWNQALETGGVLVGKKVMIELEVQAIKA